MNIGSFCIIAAYNQVLFKQQLGQFWSHGGNTLVPVWDCCSPSLGIISSSYKEKVSSDKRALLRIKCHFLARPTVSFAELPLYKGLSGVFRAFKT